MKDHRINARTTAAISRDIDAMADFVGVTRTAIINLTMREAITRARRGKIIPDPLLEIDLQKGHADGELSSLAKIASLRTRVALQEGIMKDTLAALATAKEATRDATRDAQSKRLRENTIPNFAKETLNDR